MAEDNSDQNIAQPQDGTQQTAPQTPSENVADEAQTSVTEPIAVPNAGEQPTTALPTVDAADGTAGNTADDTPDYASAAGVADHQWRQAGLRQITYSVLITNKKENVVRA